MNEKKIEVNSVIDRLKISLGMTNKAADTALSNILGLSGGAVQSWKKRNKIPYQECAIVSLDNGVSLEWLLSGTGEMMGNLSEIVNVPIYDIQASTGDGSLVIDEFRHSRHPIAKSFLKNLGLEFESTAVIYVVGDSMHPALNSGDQILINMSVKSIIADGIYVIRLDDVLLVKRISRNMDKTIEVCSDNPIYKNFTLSQQDFSDVRIIGKVSMVMSKV